MHKHSATPGEPRPHFAVFVCNAALAIYRLSQVHRPINTGSAALEVHVHVTCDRPHPFENVPSHDESEDFDWRKKSFDERGEPLNLSKE